MPSTRIASPTPAVVTSVVDATLIACSVRGRILEVSVLDSTISPSVGDTVLIELIPSSKQWIVLVIVPP